MRYKNLLSEKKFLKVQVRARALMGTGTDLIAIYYKNQELVFKTRSGTDRRLVWTQTIHLNDVTIENLLACKSFFEIENLIKNSNLKIYCDCPAWLYWGYKYIAWKKGYGLVKEFHRPIVRNPHQQGALCKHLYLVLQLFPFITKEIASKYRNYAVKKEEYDAYKKNIQNVRMNKANRNYVQSMNNNNNSNEPIKEEDLEKELEENPNQ